MGAMTMKRPALDKPRRFVREALTENLRLKALAMVITILVFALVRGGREETARFTIDVELIPPPPTAKRVLMTEVPETIKLRVRGSPRVVQMINEDEFPPLILDLREERNGAFAVDGSLIQLPPGLEVESVLPASIGLRYEPRIEREVRVVPVVFGQVADGHHLEDPVEAEPSNVMLSGPRSVVRERQEVPTELISVEGLGPGTYRRRILLQQAPSNCIFDGSEQVTVELVVAPDQIERTFENVTVEVRGAGDLVAQAEPISVVLRGEPETVRRVGAEDLVAHVDLGADGGTPGSYRREVQLGGVDQSLQVTLVPAAVIVEVERPAPTGPPPEPPVAP